MTPITSHQMICGVAAKVLAPGAIKVPRGWDATDPAGCWMKDRPEAPDYCQGFKMFLTYEAADRYAVSLGTPYVMRYDNEVMRWTVEPMAGDYGC